MSCNSIAVIRAKISNKVFAKLLRMADIQKSLGVLAKAENLPLYFFTPDDKHLSFQLDGIYVVVTLDGTGFEIYARGNTWEGEKMRNVKEKVTQAINRMGTIKLSQAVNAFLKIKGYEVTETNVTPVGVTINFEGKE